MFDEPCRQCILINLQNFGCFGSVTEGWSFMFMCFAKFYRFCKGFVSEHQYDVSDLMNTAYWVFKLYGALIRCIAVQDQYGVFNLMNTAYSSTGLIHSIHIFEYGVSVLDSIRRIRFSEYGVFDLVNTAYWLQFTEEEKMVDEHHKEVQKASTSKGAESPIYDATRDENENESSSNSEGPNYGGFMEAETKALRSMINKQVGKAIKNAMPNDMTTYHDFMACDVRKFDGALDPIASTRWLAAVEGAFRTSNCKEKSKVNFASNFLRDSAKMWWEGKVYEKEVDRIREEFQTLMQTNESVNEIWKKFNDLIRYCPEYHGNEKLKVKRFQRMLRDDIREVISPFKCNTLDDLLSRARVREADLLRKKNKEAKETKRKIEFRDRDAKKPKNDQGRKSEGTQIKTPCKKCHKTHLGVCRANLPGCYKCGALNHMSKDCKKPMILCYSCNQLGHNSNKCPNPKAIEAKPLKSIKE
ncbi:zinc finger, CCHC-type, retrotransposon gag domain protein [Tanacetum coccineum]